MKISEPSRLRELERVLARMEGVTGAAVVIREESSAEMRIPVEKIFIGPPSSHPAFDTRREENTDHPARSVKACVHGVAHHPGSPVPSTLGRVLSRAAGQYPDQGIRYLEGDGTESSQSYRELYADARRALAGLRRCGIGKGDRVIFQFLRNREFITTFWACVLGGIIPAPLGAAPSYRERNSAVERLFGAWDLLEKPLIVASGSIAEPLERLGENAGLDGFRVARYDRIEEGGSDDQPIEPSPEDDALFLLTSGSTGKPKAVRQPHRNLIANSAGIADFFGLTSGERSLNWMPLDHVGGIVFFHLRDVFLGCGQVHVQYGTILQDPLRWIDLLDRFRATVTWAPNFAFNIVNESIGKQGARAWDLSSVRIILNGGEPLVAKTARRFLANFIPHGLPSACMYPAWGMSETCGGVLFSRRLNLETVTDRDSFVELGTPINGVSFRIVDNDNRVRNEPEAGRLQVCGATVTPGYFKRPELAAEVMTPDGWFDTGDLGFIRDGQVTITGRSKDAIIVNGVNFYCHEIESVVESVAGVAASCAAAVAVRLPGDNTDRLAVFFAPAIAGSAEPEGLIRSIRSSVMEKTGINPYAIIPLAREDIPKTAIGKIQRTELGSRFMKGAFDHLLSRSGLLNQGETVPAWFLAKRWHPAPLKGEAVPLGGRRVLILGGPGKFGAGLLLALKNAGMTCVRAECDPQFAIPQPGQYRFNPVDADQFRQLFEHLNGIGFVPEEIINLIPLEPRSGGSIETALERGLYPIVRLVQALEPRRPAKLRLLTCCRRAFGISAGDGESYCHAGLEGFIRSLALEEPWMECRLVDVEETSGCEPLLMSELACAGGETVTAWRCGQRFRPQFEQVDLTAASTGLPIVRGGAYLLTGGLGGIGGHLAERLIEEYDARLLVVGRSRLGETRVSTDRASVLRKLSGIGNVRYEAVDVADFESIACAVETAEMDWGQPLDGIFHLAGEGAIAGHSLELHRVRSEKLENYARMYRAKAAGTENLFHLIEHRPETLFVAFSSSAGELGSVAYSAYAAANSFQEHCCGYHAARGFVNAYCLSWSMWDNLGMSRNAPDYARAAASRRGYRIIGPRDGYNSFLAGISTSERQLIIGLDPANRSVSDRLADEPATVQKLNVYYSSARNGSMAGLVRNRLKDMLEPEVPFEIFEMATIPRLPDGRPDHDSLASRAPERCHPSRIAPRNDQERMVAHIWADVLDTRDIGIHDNFFDLGGNSLLVAKLSAGIRESFARDITMTDLFKYPTIASFVSFLTGGAGEEKTKTLEESLRRGAGRRERMRRRNGASKPAHPAIDHSFKQGDMK